MTEGFADRFKQLRVASNFGGCRILGIFLRESKTGKTLFYLAHGDGPERRISKTRKPRFAGEVAPRPHTEPCLSCRDHPDSLYGKGRCSVHGSEITPGFGCWTCRST